MDADSKKFDYATIFCDKCDYSCRRKDQIKRHQATKHEGFRFKCTKCEKEYQTSKNLDEHQRQNMKVLDINAISVILL